MTEFLLTLFSLSLGGAAAICLVGLAGRLFRSRYAARWRCWVWLALALRLALPVSLPEISRPIQIEPPRDTVIYQPVAPQPPAPTTRPPVMPEPRPLPQPPVPPVAPPVSPANPLPTRQPLTLFHVLGGIWLLGVAAMAGRALWCHLRFLAYVRRWGKAVTDPEVQTVYRALGAGLQLASCPQLKTCTGLRAPMLAGLFRPVLLLPQKLPQGDALRYALLHELSHYRRRDIWLKSLVLLANCLHWFNPAAWWMTRLVERDTELACDEAALACLPPEEYKAYGKTILDTVERLKPAAPFKEEF